MTETVLQQGIGAQAKILAEYGYPSVTYALVEAAHAKWQRGTPGTSIIELFCNDAFDRNPGIFGTPAQVDEHPKGENAEGG